MASHTLNSLGLALAGIQVAESAGGAPLHFVNNAGHDVDVVATYPDCHHFTVKANGGVGDWEYHLTDGKKVNKLWIRPQHCTKEMGCPPVPDTSLPLPEYKGPCQADCLGCFYIAPNVAPNQVTLDVGLGFGDNNPPKEHLGIGGVSLDYQDATDGNKEKHLYCNTTSCPTKDIAVVHAGGKHTVTIEAPTSHAPLVPVPSTAGSALLMFHNNASVPVHLVETEPHCGFHAIPAKSTFGPWPYTRGVNKFWVRPDTCPPGESSKKCPKLPDPKTNPNWYNDCRAECLGCFYVAPNLAPDLQTLVVGIGYGVNTPVQVHDGLGSIALQFSDAVKHGGETKLVCEQNNCNVEKIGQVLAGGKHEVWINGGSASASSVQYV